MLSILFITNTMLEDSINFATSYQAMNNTLYTQIQASRQRLSRHHSFGALKIFAFHTIMITTFIFKQVYTWITREGLHALMLVFHLFLPKLKCMIYWATIAFTIIMLLIVEAARVYAQYKIRQANSLSKENILALYPLLLYQIQ